MALAIGAPAIGAPAVGAPAVGAPAIGALGAGRAGLSPVRAKAATALTASTTVLGSWRTTTCLPKYGHRNMVNEMRPAFTLAGPVWR